MTTPIHDMKEQGPGRGPPFGLSATATVAVGLALVGMGMHYLRPTAKVEQVVVEAPPKVVEKIVERLVKVPAPPVTPPPPPPPPPTPPKVEIIAGPFEGVWGLGRGQLPMFELKQVGESLSGTYSAPDGSHPFPFKDGKVMGDIVEFAISFPLVRIHCRMTRLTNDNAKIERWITPEDAVQMIANANKPGVIRSPEQARILRLLIAQELKGLGKATMIGIFHRVPDPGRL